MGAEIFKNILRITPWLRFCSLRGDREKRRRESGGAGEKGELAIITHKFSFLPQKSLDTAKRENCHRKCAAD